VVTGKEKRKLVGFFIHLFFVFLMLESELEREQTKYGISYLT